jgi:hypothetical protein
MTSTIETITPERAEQFLQTFGGNRKRRQSWVKDLAQMMRSGNFKLTHQGLAFNTAGELFDGQHRCLAIIEYGHPVKMMITRGVDEDAWKAIDIGVKRSISDVTGIDKRFSEPMRLAARIIGATSTPSADDVIALYESRLGESLRQILTNCPTTLRYYSSAPMKLAAALWAVKSQSDYPEKQYAAMVYQKYDEMSTCSKSLCRQVAMQNVNSGNVGDSLARAYKVFDPSKADISKIVISENDAKENGAIYRQDITAILNCDELLPARQLRVTKKTSR